jgi:hypothetical protein
MKKCPTCENTFDDNLRFCQADGTPLIDISEADSYKTVVSNQNEFTAPPLDPFKTMVGTPLQKGEDDLLQLPDAPDSSKTLAISQEEMNNALAGTPSSPFDNASSGSSSNSQRLDAFGATPLEIPKFNEPSLNPPSFGELSPKITDSQQSETSSTDSTLVMNTGSTSEGFSDQTDFGKPLNQPSPSPFDAAPPTNYQAPSSPPFKEPEPPFGASNNPFNQSPFEQSPTPFGQQATPYNAPIQQTDWTPPPAPESNWQNQNIGANTPFQPPVAGVEGQDKTLAIVSLVCGILSLTCCGAVTGIAALITGFMAKNNVDANPQQYGGRGLALAGMIMGGISTILTILYVIFVLVVGLTS